MADSSDAPKSKAENGERLPRTVTEANEIVEEWDQKELTLEKIQVFAAAQDLHSAHALERLAHSITHKHNGGWAMSQSYLRTANGLNAAKVTAQLLKEASGLRKAAAVHLAQKDHMARHAELLDAKPKKVGVQVKDPPKSPILSRLEKMRAEAESA